MLFNNDNKKELERLKQQTRTLNSISIEIGKNCCVMCGRTAIINEGGKDFILVDPEHKEPLCRKHFVNNEDLLAEKRAFRNKGSSRFY
jgi:hypothetical protein